MERWRSQDWRANGVGCGANRGGGAPRGKQGAEGAAAGKDGAEGGGARHRIECAARRVGVLDGDIQIWSKGKGRGTLLVNPNPCWFRVAKRTKCHVGYSFDQSQADDRRHLIHDSTLDEDVAWRVAVQIVW